MTATYWEIVQRIVAFKQGGRSRAEYGDVMITRLSDDLTARFGRGFQTSNLYQMRAFYSVYQNIFQTPSGKFDLSEMARQFPLSWSHYVALLGARKAETRNFYEAEALRGGWSARQLKRQMSSKFYESTLLSRNKAKMLTKGA